jgi:hypothetical protein
MDANMRGPFETMPPSRLHAHYKVRGQFAELQNFRRPRRSLNPGRIPSSVSSPVPNCSNSRLQRVAADFLKMKPILGLVPRDPAVSATVQGQQLPFIAARRFIVWMAESSTISA